MSEKSILEMVGGEKHINPHYNIKAEKKGVTMFEKEAEEYAESMAKYYESAHGSIPSQFEKYLRKAVEYGYNKANEWHYVKDELPDEGTYLVVWQNDNGYKEILIMNYEEDDEEELHWVDGDCEVQDEYIIAWKELPGFPKESEVKVK